MIEFRDAIRDALAEEIERDPAVVFFGEDVAAAGGVFKVTPGLHERFGDERVFDTPISELALAGGRSARATERDTDEEARYLFTTIQQSFTNLVRGAGGKIQAPIDNIDDYWSPTEKHHATHMLKYSIVGSAETVRKGLEELVGLTKADELMIVTSIYDHSARMRSYQIVAQTNGSRST